MAYDNINRSYIGQIERSEINITILSIQKIDNALKVDIHIFS